MSKHALTAAAENPRPTKQARIAPPAIGTSHCVLSRPQCAEVEAWTADEVSQWAVKVVSSAHSKKLVDQEIDGKALLKMTEEKFERYGIPGGPATNLFEAIQQLKHEPGDFNAQLLWTVLRDKKVTEQKLNGITIYTLPEGIQWLTEKSDVLFARSCNTELYDMILILINGTPECGVVITGNPGIGKSWFLSYFLMRFAVDGRTVVFESVALDKLWVFRADGTVSMVEGPRTRPHPAEFNDPYTIYLFDPAGETPREPLQVSAYTIVTSSPKKANYKQFFKRVQRKLYLPIWTLAELLAVVPFFPHMDEQTAKQRFERFGGIPRSVCPSTEADMDAAFRELDSAIQNAKLPSILESAGNIEVLGDQSHKLLHYIVNSPYTDPLVGYASQYVIDKLSVKLANGRNQMIVDFVNAATQSTSASQLGGVLFERLVHPRLIRGGTFRVRNLHGSEEDLVIPPLTKVDVMNSTFQGVDVSQANSYFQPTSSNFPALDSVACIDDVLVGFQITVSTFHPLKSKSVEKQLESLGSPNNFRVYFVVPTSIFAEYRRQNYLGSNEQVLTRLPSSLKSVEQWVLSVDFSPSLEEKA